MANENEVVQEEVRRGRPPKAKTVRNVGSHVIVIGQPSGENIFVIPEAEAVEVSAESVERPEIVQYIKDGVLIVE